MIPIRYMLLEGPDCCGKSTLYNNVHKVTKFQYNIHDRSCLSMLCYARLYNRDVEVHRARLNEELCDANNYFVVLMPPLDVVLTRLRSRGDEFQDEKSIVSLYEIFAEETSKVAHLPNVLLVKENMPPQELAGHVALEASYYAARSPEEFGKVVRQWTSLSDSGEVQFRVSFDVSPGVRNEGIMSHPHEGEYYRQILNDCQVIFDKEIAGDNPYGVPQGKDSRRFYYSSDSCISSVHCLPRGDTFKVIATLRSTDSERNGSPDLQFLEHLSTVLQARHTWSTTKISLDVRFNSLHVRRDKV